MSYAIMRVEKLKGDLNGIGKHIDRSFQGENCSPNNSNANQVTDNLHWDNKGSIFSQNEWTEYTKINHLKKRVNDHIKENYKVDRAIRKDAVKCVEYLFTSDTQKMNDIFSDAKIYEEWIRDNREFLADIYGKENIISMHLHTDETTYHMEVVVVPITSDGRLSAKEFINGKKDLSNQQTVYAERMEKYGMQRGIKGSSARHIAPKNLNKTQNYERNSH
ncbi:plasmid recombination protein [Tenacibaculum finnmarkense genomovar ulcerans]|uniref:MobV family relaxase n=1 Tax=Tenacibaculum finnmarkense TaxID=2781243 RepID=UPI001E4B5DD1|nr:MobV family relaxase [Tenacibaculum finnmarkense]MCD8405218.1 plasmid recombination protein [Tenacibaculum dicentrarchi]MCD8428676.1 plasmid recombination protein [Tenacibaculum finnmarkense genomovar ulcerans]MCG8732469.1 hypothetical protein [Tenacibaculum finnmarkense]